MYYKIYVTFAFGEYGQSHHLSAVRIYGHQRVSLGDVIANKVVPRNPS